MPKIRLHLETTIYEQEVPENSNLVVLAGIRKFPHLKYGCGMGKCTKCACKIIKGGEHLQEPNWKEVKMLGESLNDGIRLTCQLFVEDDLERTQENLQFTKKTKETTVTK
jgi:ferredoxin